MTNPWCEASPPGFAELLAARDRIAGKVHRTPVLTSASLDQLVGARLYFKCENLQRSGAFKVRGAFNALGALSEQQVRHGVATHSSGNHGAALAMAAADRAVPAHVVVPASATRIKRDAIARWGARIIDCDASLEARERALAEVVAETGARYIAPFDDPMIIAGQGTAALELLEDCPDLAQIWAPVGGGGLISGTAIAANALCPGIDVIAAEPRNADDAWQSIQTGVRQPMTAPDTIADGLRTSLSPLTFGIMQSHGVRVVRASEQAIVRALVLLGERLKLVVEPSGAVPLAAMLDNPSAARGAAIGVILSGGNRDVEFPNPGESD